MRELSARRDWRAAVALASAGVFPVTLDSAVNVAFPAISAAFGIRVSAIQWLVVAYVLPDALLLLPAGRLADVLGHRATFRAGLAATATALALCGLAPTFGWLLAARVLQGAGAALVLASAPALVTLATPAGVRQRALGWYNLAIGVGIVLGPLLGGLLVSAWTWRAVYLIRVPLALLALGLTWRRQSPSLRAAAPPSPAAAAPISDRPAFVLANAANLMANGAQFFVWLLIPYYLVERRGLPEETAGLLFAVGTLATAIGAPVGGRWADVWGARRVMSVALGAEAAGLALVSRLDAASSIGEIAVALALAGGGIGLFTTPNMHYVMSVLPRTHQGRAGGLVVLMRMLGIVFGALAASLAYERLAFGGAFVTAAVTAGAAALLGFLPRRRPW